MIIIGREPCGRGKEGQLRGRRQVRKLGYDNKMIVSQLCSSVELRAVDPMYV